MQATVRHVEQRMLFGKPLEGWTSWLDCPQGHTLFTRAEDKPRVGESRWCPECARTKAAEAARRASPVTNPYGWDASYD